MATNTGFAISQTMILAPLPPQGFSQVMTIIKVGAVRGEGQAQAAVVLFAKQTGYAQSQADIVTPEQIYAQAQAFITI